MEDIKNLTETIIDSNLCRQCQFDNAGQPGKWCVATQHEMLEANRNEEARKLYFNDANNCKYCDHAINVHPPTSTGEILNKLLEHLGKEKIDLKVPDEINGSTICTNARTEDKLNNIIKDLHNYKKNGKYVLDLYLNDGNIVDRDNIDYSDQIKDLAELELKKIKNILLCCFHIDMSYTDFMEEFSKNDESDVQEKLNKSTENIKIIESDGKFLFSCPDNFERKIFEPDQISPQVWEIRTDFDGKDVNQQDMLNVEYECLLQGMERILCMSRFYGFLGRIVVYCSTGRRSFVCYFSRGYRIFRDENDNYRSRYYEELRIWRVGGNVPSALCRILSKKPPYYFWMVDAEIIINGLKNYGINPAYCRLSFLTQSMYSVYSLTVPVEYTSCAIPEGEYVIKVMQDYNEYNREIQVLKELKDILPWLIGADTHFTPQEEGGIILMKKGEVANKVTDKVIDDVTDHLTKIHSKGYSHCDVRLCNVIKMDDSYYMIDFGKAWKNDEDYTLLMDDDGAQYIYCAKELKEKLENEEQFKWLIEHDLIMMINSMIVPLLPKES